MNIPETTVTALSLLMIMIIRSSCLMEEKKKKKDFPYKTKHNYPVSCFPK